MMVLDRSRTCRFNFSALSSCVSCGDSGASMYTVPAVSVRRGGGGALRLELDGVSWTLKPLALDGACCCLGSLSMSGSRRARACYSNGRWPREGVGDVPAQRMEDVQKSVDECQFQTKKLNRSHEHMHSAHACDDVPLFTSILRPSQHFEGCVRSRRDFLT